MTIRALAAMLLILLPIPSVAGEAISPPPPAPVNLDFEAGSGESGYPAGWGRSYHDQLAQGR